MATRTWRRQWGCCDLLPGARGWRLRVGLINARSVGCVGMEADVDHVMYIVSVHPQSVTVFGGVACSFYVIPRSPMMARLARSLTASQ